MRRISATSQTARGPEKARAKAVSLFRQYVACLAADQRAILNLGGSSTALLYDRSVGANELSVGSAFVLPTDFDVPSLTELRPAVFIATPILKVVETEMPGLDKRSRILKRLGLLARRGCFLYGGKWMAKPVYPPGLKLDTTFGFSTNQQFMALSGDAAVAPDDYAFCARPRASSCCSNSGRSWFIPAAISLTGGRRCRFVSRSQAGEGPTRWLTKRTSIIVGSGLAGLVAAAELADAGKRVLIVEIRSRADARRTGVAFLWRCSSSICLSSAG